jgi:PKD repeat protein
MTARLRQLVPGLVLLAALAALAVSAPAQARAAVDARFAPGYVMHGLITTAVRVRGEHRGQTVIRRWTFQPRSCSPIACAALVLHRSRARGRIARVILQRDAPGRYAGSGRFYSALRCRRRIYRRGEVVPYRITVQVAQVVSIDGIPIASELQATYVNRRRLDRTPCPLGPSHDAARYTGAAAPLPTPPAAAFVASVNPATGVARFSDSSSLGAGGAPIVAHAWNFGDPASGAADTASTPNASHTFGVPGVYTVTLSVTDADGLSAAVSRQVTVPGPPVARFSAVRLGSSLSYAFTDRSTAGLGGAPIRSWAWTFGDPGSGAGNSSAKQNPDHTFGAPGSYQVCLIVVDANGREGGTCASIAVASGIASRSAARLDPERRQHG